MHVNIQEVYMQTAIAMYCEFISYVQGFGMHETISMQALLTFCVYQGDLAFPECPSGLPVHLKASLIPLQRSIHQHMGDGEVPGTKEKCI